MPRTVSISFRNSFYAPYTDDNAIMLMTIEHEDIEGGIVRLSSDPTTMLNIEPLSYGTISNGEEYLALFIEGTLPDEEEGVPSSATFVFQNVTRELIAAVRSTTDRAEINISIVSIKAPDFVEEQYTKLKAVQCRYDANTLTLEVSRDDFTSQGFPYHRMSKSRFPGLFP